MKVAIYARVSTEEQNLDNQLNRLREYCKSQRWEYDEFTEKETTRKTRPIQYELYRRLLQREYEGLVIIKFDRWARSTTELVTHFSELVSRNVRVVSLSEAIDFGTSYGKLAFTILAAMAEFERDLIRERTIAGLARARAQGRPIGKRGKDRKKRRARRGG